MTTEEMKARLLPFDDIEAKKMIRASRTEEPRLMVSAAVRARVATAIVLIHHQARYFEGMAILSGLAGWKPRILENEYDSPEEQMNTRQQFNAWVKKMGQG